MTFPSTLYYFGKSCKNASTKHKGLRNCLINTVQYQTVDNDDISTLWRLSTSAKGFTATSAYKINKSNQPLPLTIAVHKGEIASNYTSSSFTNLDLKIFDTGCVVFHNHYDVIKWKHFPRYLPFVMGIHRSAVLMAIEPP